MGKKNRKIKSRLVPTQHHIIPSSRGGDSSEDNIAWVQNRKHENYHRMFDNKTPVEIIEFLVNTYWKGNYSYVCQYLKRLEVKNG